MNLYASITSGEGKSKMKRSLKVCAEEEKNKNREKRFCNYFSCGGKKWALKTIPIKRKILKDQSNVYLSGLSLYLPQIVKFVKFSNFKVGECLSMHTVQSPTQYKNLQYLQFMIIQSLLKPIVDSIGFASLRYLPIPLVLTSQAKTINLIL